MAVFMVRADYRSPWIYYRSWFVWRWGQRFPEDIGFADVEYRHHRDDHLEAA